ncbi:MAG: DUF3141 domain-containing protein [Pseudomonadota bacterium]
MAEEAGSQTNGAGESNSIRTPLETFQRQAALIHSLTFKHTQTIAQAQFEATRKTFDGFQKMVPLLFSPNVFQDMFAYWRDVGERSVLFTETLYDRGNNAVAREEEGLKPVLAFDYDMIVDGRGLDRPVNYALVRIIPPEDFPAQREDGRPWVIVDPRAGHGSGIGGFKSESEVGVALADGHPVYFVIFFPNPEPEQTLADVCQAEATFLRAVRSRHPNSPRPLVTGNCQGGWASMILAATHPDLAGPVVIAGAPLSYWAGEVGKNPFRYLGGMMGGAVPALLSSDLGGGKFDGAHLVFNFEGLNPARTWWRKNYDLFAGEDGAERFLEFERWWSGFYFMNEAEIRWIVENLFIGNRLARGKAILNDGTPVDLTRIEAPVIVFASHGDNITPPQQALNWIPDLYESVDDLRAKGHVIIYTLHESVGHLGIFVSAQVASKQHKQITSVVKTIEALSPGLYEMKIDMIDGVYQVAFEDRTMDDILALGDGRDEDPDFAAVAQFSEWATKTYELTLRPFIQQVVTPDVAEHIKNSHPMRRQLTFFSSKNPALSSIKERARKIRENRSPVDTDNPFLQAERLWADTIETGWNRYRDCRDAIIEIGFHTIWGSPHMRRLGMVEESRPAVKDAERLPEVRQILSRVKQGGYPEAIVRMLVILARARGSVRRDRLERAHRVLHSKPPFDNMPEARRAQMIHDQTMIVDFAGKEAISSLPDLLHDEVDRIRAIDLVLTIVGPPDEMNAPTLAMFKHLQAVLRQFAKGWHDPAHSVRTRSPNDPMGSQMVGMGHPVAAQ